MNAAVPSIRTSEILQRIVDDCRSGAAHITIGQLIDRLGDRAFALALLVFALPCVIAGVIPGFSTLTGIPIMLIAAQMVLAREVIWLPQSTRVKEIPRDTLCNVLMKSIPSVVWIEKFLRPRWQWVGTRAGERLIGLLIVVLAAVLSLPIPGGNFLPSFSISVLALAVLERDGLLGVLGVAFILGTATFMIKLIELAWHLVSSWMMHLF